MAFSISLKSWTLPVKPLEVIVLVELELLSKFS